MVNVTVAIKTSINMLRLAILFAAIACVLGAAIPEGMIPQLDGRIVDGLPTSIRSFPWQVSLQRGGSHSCGGSIYTNQIIVTAAHCLQRVSISALRVRAGSSFWVSGGVLVSVAEFKNHEEYNPNTMVNDIAVIRLSTFLIFSSTTRPIRLASIAPKDESPAVVSGWGTTISGSNTIPSQLKSVDMRILTRSLCASSKFGYGALLTDTMICTYAIGKDSCQGDSGGPLVSGGVLVGVVSWGFGCAHSKYPGVYADVAVLRSWIIRTSKAI